jgi:hypothetical protein
LGTSYLLSTLFYFTGDHIDLDPVFSIEYDCVPSIEPSIPPATGIWKICDAEVNVQQGPLSDIIDMFNSLLGGRVSLTNLSGGQYYVGGNFVDTIQAPIRTISDGKATYTYRATHTYLTPCGIVQHSGLGPKDVYPPDPGLRDATIGNFSYYTGNEHDTWTPLSGLGLSVCSCSLTVSPDNADYLARTDTCSPPCPSFTSDYEYDNRCGDMSVN